MNELTAGWYGIWDAILEVLEEFVEDLEEPRINKLFGNWGVKKDPGPRETRNGEFFVPFLYWTHVRKSYIYEKGNFESLWKKGLSRIGAKNVDPDKHMVKKKVRFRNIYPK